MKLDEAIEILDSPRFGTVWPTPLEEETAKKLGVEALKRELEYRESMPPKEGELLPGETLD